MALANPRSHPPKKRVQLIQIPNKKLFVLGYDKERVINIIGYDVTYKHIKKYDLDLIRSLFMERARDFDKFSFIGYASDDTLKTISQRGTIEMQLPAHLLQDWQRVMINTLPHFSYFCLAASELNRLDRNMEQYTAIYQQMCPELQYMVDQRNMILGVTRPW